MNNEEIRLECLKLAGNDMKIAQEYSEFALYGKIKGDDQPKPVIAVKKSKK